MTRAELLLHHRAVVAEARSLGVSAEVEPFTDSDPGLNVRAMVAVKTLRETYHVDTLDELYDVLGYPDGAPITPSKPVVLDDGGEF